MATRAQSSHRRRSGHFCTYSLTHSFGAAERIGKGRSVLLRRFPLSPAPYAYCDQARHHAQAARGNRLANTPLHGSGPCRLHPMLGRTPRLQPLMGQTHAISPRTHSTCHTRAHIVARESLTGIVRICRKLWTPLYGRHELLHMVTRDTSGCTDKQQ